MIYLLEAGSCGNGAALQACRAAESHVMFDSND